MFSIIFKGKDFEPKMFSIIFKGKDFEPKMFSINLKGKDFELKKFSIIFEGKHFEVCNKAIWIQRTSRKDYSNEFLDYLNDSSSRLSELKITSIVD